MKRLLIICLFFPNFIICQVKVEVSQKQTFSQSFNESMQAGAAASQARAANAQADAAKAAAMNQSYIDVTKPIDVDLNKYSHLALVSIKYADGSMSKSVYSDMANDLSDSPFVIVNPYTFDKVKAKKDVRFLKAIKNPNWLYIYYERSTVGVDEIRRVIVRDLNNKTIYNATGRNMPASKVFEPLVFAEVNNTVTSDLYISETEKDEARLKRESEATEKAEYEARLKRELEAKEKAEYEARLKRELEAKEKAEYEARLKRESEAKEKAEYEARLKRELEAKVKAEYEARLKKELESKENTEYDANIQQEAESELTQNLESEHLEKSNFEFDINLQNMKAFSSSTILNKDQQIIYKLLGVKYRAVIASVINKGSDYSISKVQYYVPLNSTWIKKISLNNYSVVKSKNIIGYK